MSEKGQSRHSEGAPITSGLPQQTDISRDGHVSKVPPTDILPTQPPCRLTARRIRAVPDQAILQRFEIEDEFEFGWLLNR
jgi:hypothetical protein